MKRQNRTGLVIAAMLVLPVDAQAQDLDERTDIHWRNDCRLAEQILRSGNPDPHRDWALQVIGTCQELGGAVLAMLWSTAQPDQRELMRMYWSSAELRDARVLEAVSATAIDGAAPLDVRLNALRVLGALVDPHFDISLEDLYPPAEGLVARRHAYVDHRVQFEGAAPFPPNYEERILSLLDALATTGSDPVVRFAAQLIHEQVTNDPQASD